MISLDTSALASLFIEDDNTTAMNLRIARPGAVIAVSTFAAAELASAVSRRLRMGLYHEPGANQLLAIFDAWCADHAAILDVESQDHVAAASFVRRFDLGLRAPDALHIAVCRRLGLALLTFDTRQASAARQLGVVCDPAGAVG